MNLVLAAVVCVTLVDRLNGDQVEISHETNLKFQERPFRLVGEYIKKHLNANGNGNAKTNGKVVRSGTWTWLNRRLLANPIKHKKWG